ncbi:hypothetical protein M8J75_001141 [Diaphorina citri]|nr:hypothetical protein M8J75_001141 [Diaphorina citri]
MLHSDCLCKVIFSDLSTIQSANYSVKPSDENILLNQHHDNYDQYQQFKNLFHTNNRDTHCRMFDITNPSDIWSMSSMHNDFTNHTKFKGKDFDLFPTAGSCDSTHKRINHIVELFKHKLRNKTQSRETATSVSHILNSLKPHLLDLFDNMSTRPKSVCIETTHPPTNTAITAVLTKTTTAVTTEMEIPKFCSVEISENSLTTKSCEVNTETLSEVSKVTTPTITPSDTLESTDTIQIDMDRSNITFEKNLTRNFKGLKLSNNSFSEKSTRTHPMDISKYIKLKTMLFNEAYKHGKKESSSENRSKDNVHSEKSRLEVKVASEAPNLNDEFKPKARFEKMKHNSRNRARQQLQRRYKICMSDINDQSDITPYEEDSGKCVDTGHNAPHASRKKYWRATHKMSPANDRHDMKITHIVRGNKPCPKYMFRKSKKVRTKNSEYTTLDGPDGQMVGGNGEEKIDDNKPRTKQFPIGRNKNKLTELATYTNENKEHDEIKSEPMYFDKDSELDDANSSKTPELKRTDLHLSVLSRDTEWMGNKEDSYYHSHEKRGKYRAKKKLNHNNKVHYFLYSLPSQALEPSDDHNLFIKSGTKKYSPVKGKVSLKNSINCRQNYSVNDDIEGSAIVQHMLDDPFFESKLFDPLPNIQKEINLETCPCKMYRDHLRKNANGKVKPMEKCNHQQKKKQNIQQKNLGIRHHKDVKKSLNFESKGDITDDSKCLYVILPCEKVLRHDFLLFKVPLLENIHLNNNKNDKKWADLSRIPVVGTPERKKGSEHNSTEQTENNQTVDMLKQLTKAIDKLNLSIHKINSNKCSELNVSSTTTSLPKRDNDIKEKASEHKQNNENECADEQKETRKEKASEHKQNDKKECADEQKETQKEKASEHKQNNKKECADEQKETRKEKASEHKQNNKNECANEQKETRKEKASEHKQNNKNECANEQEETRKEKASEHKQNNKNECANEQKETRKEKASEHKQNNKNECVDEQKETRKEECVEHENEKGTGDEIDGAEEKGVTNGEDKASKEKINKTYSKAELNIKKNNCTTNKNKKPQGRSCTPTKDKKHNNKQFNQDNQHDIDVEDECAEIMKMLEKVLECNEEKRKNRNMPTIPVHNNDRNYKNCERKSQKFYDDCYNVLLLLESYLLNTEKAEPHDLDLDKKKSKIVPSNFVDKTEETRKYPNKGKKPKINEDLSTKPTNQIWKYLKNTTQNMSNVKFKVTKQTPRSNVEKFESTLKSFSGMKRQLRKDSKKYFNSMLKNRLPSADFLEKIIFHPNPDVSEMNIKVAQPKPVNNETELNFKPYREKMNGHFVGKTSALNMSHLAKNSKKANVKDKSQFQEKLFEQNYPKTSIISRLLCETRNYDIQQAYKTSKTKEKLADIDKYVSKISRKHGLKNKVTRKINEHEQKMREIAPRVIPSERSNIVDGYYVKQPKTLKLRVCKELTERVCNKERKLQPSIEKMVTADYNSDDDDDYVDERINRKMKNNFLIDAVNKGEKSSRYKKVSKQSKSRCNIDSEKCKTRPRVPAHRLRPTFDHTYEKQNAEDWDYLTSSPSIITGPQYELNEFEYTVGKPEGGHSIKEMLITTLRYSVVSGRKNQRSGGWEEKASRWNYNEGSNDSGRNAKSRVNIPLGNCSTNVSERLELMKYNGMYYYPCDYYVYEYVDDGDKPQAYNATRKSNQVKQCSSLNKMSSLNSKESNPSGKFVLNYTKILHIYPEQKEVDVNMSKKDDIPKKIENTKSDNMNNLKKHGTKSNKQRSEPVSTTRTVLPYALSGTTNNNVSILTHDVSRESCTIGDISLKLRTTKVFDMSDFVVDDFLKKPVSKIGGEAPWMNQNFDFGPTEAPATSKSNGRMNDISEFHLDDVFLQKPLLKKQQMNKYRELVNEPLVLGNISTTTNDMTEQQVPSEKTESESREIKQKKETTVKGANSILSQKLKSVKLTKKFAREKHMGKSLKEESPQKINVTECPTNVKVKTSRVSKTSQRKGLKSKSPRISKKEKSKGGKSTSNLSKSNVARTKIKPCRKNTSADHSSKHKVQYASESDLTDDRKNPDLKISIYNITYLPKLVTFQEKSFKRKSHHLTKTSQEEPRNLQDLDFTVKKCGMDKSLNRRKKKIQSLSSNVYENIIQTSVNTSQHNYLEPSSIRTENTSLGVTSFTTMQERKMGETDRLKHLLDTIRNEYYRYNSDNTSRRDNLLDTKQPKPVQLHKNIGEQIFELIDENQVEEKRKPFSLGRKPKHSKYILNKLLKEIHKTIVTNRTAEK